MIHREYDSKTWWGLLRDGRKLWYALPVQAVYFCAYCNHLGPIRRRPGRLRMSPAWHSRKIAHLYGGNTLCVAVSVPH